jgi:Plasmid pRiA4b ORF-3-like protein
MPKRAAPRQPATAGPKPTVAQLHVALADIDPPIWRRLFVPYAIALRSLHATLQIAFGWSGEHLYEFRVREHTYSEPLPNNAIFDVESVVGVRLRQIAPTARTRFDYVYDLGDDWRHVVTVEALLPNSLVSSFGPMAVELPFCLTGARAGPLEDSGGPFGYDEMLAILADPKHPEHEALRLWAGADFDPEAWSARQTNRELSMFAALKATGRR